MKNLLGVLCACCVSLFGILTCIPLLTAGEQPRTGVSHNMSLREIAQNKLHHDGERFTNPFNSKHYRDFSEVLRWKLFSKNQFKQFYKDEEVLPVRIDWHEVADNAGVSITFITHSTIMIKDMDTYILVDPVLFGLFWPITDFTPIDFDLKDMPKPAYILVTHGHYDHLDKRSLKYFADTARYISPLGYRDILEDVGAQSITELDWFDSHRDGSREIMLLPCNHWTMRNPIVGPNTALWGSFLVKTSTGHTIYISGDTAYFDRFSEIGREFDIDLAIFNLGAYEPRWFMKKSHISPEDTLRAFQELRAKKLLVVHWGTFRLGDEPVHFPIAAIKKVMDQAGLSGRLVDLRHGGTMYLDEVPGTR